MVFDDYDTPRRRGTFRLADAASARVQTLVGLAFEPDTRRWTAAVDRIFRPMGLLVTGAPPGALLAEWTIGNQRCLPFGPNPIALSVFAELDLLDDGIRKSPRPSLPAMDIGQKMSLSIIDRDSRRSLGDRWPESEPSAGGTYRPVELTVWGVGLL